MKKFFILLYKLINSLNKLEAILIFIGLALFSLFIIIPFAYFYQKIFADDQPSYQGIIKEAFYQPINSLNPFWAENIAEKTLVNLIYDSLVRPDGKGNYELELADKIITLDKGLKYEITLKEAYWSNGERINVSDVIESFNYFKLYSSNNYLKDYFKNITLEKIDNYKFTLTLPLKDNLFLQKLSYIKIIPAKIWSKYEPSNWKENEEELIKISSGPFVFFQKNNNTYEFIRNNYYRPRPHLEKVIVYNYQKIEEAYQQLKIKKINAIGGLMPNFLDNNISQTLRIEKIIIPRIIGLFFNANSVDEKKVNELKTIINRNEILTEIFNSRYGELSDSIFSPSIKKILALPQEEIQQPIGNPSQFNFKIIVPDGYLMNKLGIYLQKKYGLNIEIKSLNEINNLIIPSKKYEGLLYGISYNLIPDLRLFFEDKSLLNLTNKYDPEIIKLIQEIEIGDNISPATFKKLDERIKNLPIIFLANLYYVYVVPNNLRNFNVFYLNDPSEKFVKIEEWYLK